MCSVFIFILFISFWISISIFICLYSFSLYICFTFFSPVACFFSFFTFIFSLRLLHVIHEDLHLHHLHLEIQSIICLPIETSWPFVRLGRHMRNSETVRALNGPQENGLILQSFNGQNYTFPSTVSQFLGGLFFVFPESLDIQTPPVRRYLDPKNIPKNIFKHLVRIGNKYYLFDHFFFFPSYIQCASRCFCCLFCVPRWRNWLLRRFVTYDVPNQSQRAQSKWKKQTNKETNQQTNELPKKLSQLCNTTNNSDNCAQSRLKCTTSMRTTWCVLAV